MWTPELSAFNLASILETHFKFVQCLKGNSCRVRRWEEIGLPSNTRNLAFTTVWTDTDETDRAGESRRERRPTEERKKGKARERGRATNQTKGTERKEQCN